MHHRTAASESRQVRPLGCSPVSAGVPHRWAIAVGLAFGPLWFVRPASCAESNAMSEVWAPAEVVALTLAHSPALRAADQDVKAAGWRRRQASANGNPTFDARAGYLHYDGIRNEPLAPGVSIPELQDRYAVSAGANLPLYTGGRVSSMKEGAAWSESAALLNRTASADDLTLQATVAYWNWARAFHQTAALQAAVARMEAVVADVTAMNKAGLATESDLLSAQVQLDQTQLRRADCLRQTDQAVATLSFLTGAPLASTRRPQEPASDNADVPDLPHALAMARTNRADIASARAGVEAARRQVGAAEADRRPQLALGARYEEARPNGLDFPPSDTWKDNAFVGATATWSLWDGGLARAKAGEAAARADQAAFLAAQLVERAEWEVQTARIGLVSARERTATARHAERSATRNVKTVTDLWKSGLARHSEVLDAEWRLTDSQFQTLSAQTDVQVSLAQLRYAMGTIANP